MTLTVRLDEHLQGQLDRYCKANGMTKTQVVTQLLSEHLSPKVRDAATPMTLARRFGIVGSFASGQGDLAENRKRYLMDKLRAKRSG